jgi:hypothetical protein
LIEGGAPGGGREEAGTLDRGRNAECPTTTPAQRLHRRPGIDARERSIQVNKRAQTRELNIEDEGAQAHGSQKNIFGILQVDS